MFPQSNRAADPAVEAAHALLAARDAGMIPVAACVRDFQRNEIDRELRVSSQILKGASAEDQRGIAMGIVCNVRHGLASGALVVARGDVAAHVQATIAPITHALDFEEWVPSVWFDGPAEIAAVIV